MTASHDTNTSTAVGTFQLPLDVSHEVDAVTFELRPNGAMNLERSRHPLVRLDPQEAYALAMFMRLPSVLALLEAQNTARQTRNEIDYQNDPETVAARAASVKQAR